MQFAMAWPVTASSSSLRTSLLSPASSPAVLSPTSSNWNGGDGTVPLKLQVDWLACWLVPQATIITTTTSTAIDALGRPNDRET